MPVLIAPNTEPPGDLSVPSLFFKKAVVKADIYGMDLYLDPCCESCRFRVLPAEDGGAAGLNVLEKKLERLPMPPPKDNATAERYYVKLSGDGETEIVSTFTYTGAKEAEARALFQGLTQQAKRDILAETAASLFPSARLTRFEVNGIESAQTPLEIAFDAVAQGCGGADVEVLGLPGLAAGVSRLFSGGYAYCAVAEAKTYCWEIIVPKYFAPLEVPSSFQLKNCYAGFSLYCAPLGSAHGKIKCEAQLERSPGGVAAEDMQSYRTFVEQALWLSNSRIILKKI
jgi:hypothetical protein